MRPGEVFTREGTVLCNAGREAVSIEVENTSGHAVSVTSHYHFFEANRLLRFDRRAAYGRRLDVPAGAAVRWEPGERKRVRLVDVGGARRVHGFHGLVNGALDEADADAAVERAIEAGFLHEDVSPSSRPSPA